MFFEKFEKVALVELIVQHTSLFRNKRFVLNELFQENAPTFAILNVYENPCSFCFS